VFAEKNGRFSTIQEETVFDLLIGVASGMNHLAQRGVGVAGHAFFDTTLCKKNS
jgi:hypothetical protein